MLLVRAPEPTQIDSGDLLRKSTTVRGPGVIRCGFIGLGSQGAPIARRIIDAGYSTVLWARRAASLEPFRDSSATFARSIGELAAASDQVGLCVIDDAAVREVCDELIPAMRPGSRLVVHSTTLPDTCKAVAEQALAHGLAFIEAPVSGGAPAAEAGALTIMAAGRAEAIEAARPIFETFASLIIHLGDVGAAQTAKLINNSLMAANLGLAHSAMSIGIACGIDRQALGRLLNASSGRSYALEVYTGMPSPASFTHSHSLFGKIELLAQVVGHDDPALNALRDAAAPLRDQGEVSRESIDAS
jgi:3-hydroxyisobutyrate dehydrogenase-like beta-hydroxyacid dehydrogenase